MNNIFYNLRRNLIDPALDIRNWGGNPMLKQANQQAQQYAAQRNKPNQVQQPTQKSTPTRPPQEEALNKARVESLKQLRENPGMQAKYSVQPSGEYKTWTENKPQRTMASTTQPSQTGQLPQVEQTSQQATDTSGYVQQYQDYLRNREQRAQAMAEEQARQAQAEAERTYGMERAGLEEQQRQAGEALGQYRERTMADIEAARAQGERAKGLAREESGAAQRQLAMTRRQQAGELERKYAALGTIDSYGVGSFTGANTNLETDFLRQTNENLNMLQNRVAEIEDTYSKAYTDAQRRIQDEETKYNQAVREINRLLAGNESMKAQALQQASSMLRQKQMEIADDIESLRLTLAKEQAEAQKALRAEQTKDQAIMQEFATLSDEFKNSGIPQTANDAFFANKYPDYMKNLQNIYKEKAKTTSTPKLTEKQSQFRSAAGAAQQALDLLNEGVISQGPLFAALTRGVQGITGTQPKELVQYQALLAAARGAALNALLGANMTEVEMERIKDFIPNVNDFPEKAKAKLQIFIQEMNRNSQPGTINTLFSTTNNQQGSYDTESFIDY